MDPKLIPDNKEVMDRDKDNKDMDREDNKDTDKDKDNRAQIQIVWEVSLALLSTNSHIPINKLPEIKVMDKVAITETKGVILILLDLDNLDTEDLRDPEECQDRVIMEIKVEDFLILLHLVNLGSLILLDRVSLDLVHHKAEDRVHMDPRDKLVVMEIREEEEDFLILLVQGNLVSVDRNKVLDMVVLKVPRQVDILVLLPKIHLNSVLQAEVVHNTLQAHQITDLLDKVHLEPSLGVIHLLMEQ